MLTESRHEKLAFGHMATSEMQISLHIHTVRPGSSLSTYRILVYCRTAKGPDQTAWMRAHLDLVCSQMPRKPFSYGASQCIFKTFKIIYIGHIQGNKRALIVDVGNKCPDYMRIRST